MSTHKLRFLIKPSDICSKIDGCKEVIITNATVFKDGSLEIDCIASDDEIVKHDDCRYIFSSCENIRLEK